jgi:hypothetical protein
MSTVAVATRRLEIPFMINDHQFVMIARENNDGHALSYVYCLTAEIAKSELEDSCVYPETCLEDGEVEHCFGEYDCPYHRYNKTREMAWADAQKDADEQVAFLTVKSA